jgi:hypothetical protein
MAGTLTINLITSGSLTGHVSITIDPGTFDLAIIAAAL